MCQIRASHRAMPQCVDAISISLCHRCNLIFSSRDHLDKYLMIILTNTCWSYLWEGKANHDGVRHSQLSWLQWHCGYLKFCRQTILFLRIRTCHCKSFPLNSVDTSARSKENSERGRGFEIVLYVSSVNEYDCLRLALLLMMMSKDDKEEVTSCKRCRDLKRRWTVRHGLLLIRNKSHPQHIRACNPKGNPIPLNPHPPVESAWR